MGFITRSPELMIAIRSASITALTLLGACATTGIPEGTPTAMLRFTADGYMAQISPFCPGDRPLVKLGLVNNQFWTEVSPVRMYGTRDDKNNQVLERLIPAGRQIGFRFAVSRPSTTRTTEYYDCSLVFAFTPAAGEQYQADYQWPPGSERCTVKLSRLALNNGAIRKFDAPAKVFKSGARDDNAKANDAVCAGK